jgi:hypothetical protein
VTYVSLSHPRPEQRAAELVSAVTGAHFSGSERSLHVGDTYVCKLERLPQVSTPPSATFISHRRSLGTTVSGR